MNQSQAQIRKVAQNAFSLLQQGLATGKWNPFLDCLTDDFVFWFPVGKYRGRNEGKEKAGEFFQYVTQLYPLGLTLYLERITSNENTVVFELHDEGLIRGEVLYRNRAAISFDVRGNQICAYREYLGSDGKFSQDYNLLV